MRLVHVLPLAALATAFVVPDEQLANQLVLEPQRDSGSLLDKLPTKGELISEIENTFSGVVESSKNVYDDALSFAIEAAKKAKKANKKFFCPKSMTAFDAQSWLDTEIENDDSLDLCGGGDHPPHHGRPPHRGPHHGPHHGHHGHHGHHKPNLTIYQLISKSKYTTKLAKLIDEDEELVKLLNGTAANYTIFAPTDAAFKKIPKHAPKPSKEIIKKVLLYHVSPEFYPAGRVLVTRTIPTLLQEPALGDNPQRLVTNIGLKGLTVNFYSKIIAVDIFGTNGVIHGVNSLLIPPPKAADILTLLPGEFSTLELGLVKTGLFPDLNSTTSHKGGTVFAPSNFAFKKLGPKINAFLFSSYGEKYLKALLEYHLVANSTFYTDAFYKAESLETAEVPKGHFHVDLPTLLEDHSLSIDVARWGRLIDIKINGYSSIAVSDGIAKDAVIHIVKNVLIPPKKLGGLEKQQWQDEDEELTEEDLIERLEPFVKKGEI